jgi:PAS domain-containing protein
MPRLAMIPSTQQQLESIGIGITARKQLEEASQEPARPAALIADICLALTRGGTLQAILGHYAESIVPHLGAAFARIWTLNSQQHMLELQASEERYRDLIEGSIQGVIIHRYFKPLFVNQTYATIFGYTPEESLAMESTLALFAPHERVRLQRYYLARLRNEALPTDLSQVLLLRAKSEN